MRRGSKNGSNGSGNGSGEMNEADFRRLVEERVQAYFSGTPEQFAVAFRNGDLDDDPAALDLALLVGAERSAK